MSVKRKLIPLFPDDVPPKKKVCLGLDVLFEKLPPELVEKVFDYLPVHFLLKTVRHFPKSRALVYNSRRLVHVEGSILNHIPLKEVRSCTIGALDNFVDKNDKHYSKKRKMASLLQWQKEYLRSKELLCGLGETLNDLTINVPYPRHETDNFLDNVKKNLKNMTSLTLGKDSDATAWSFLWKGNSTLKVLRILTENPKYSLDLPETLQEFEGVNVERTCLDSCKDSLISLKLFSPRKHFYIVLPNLQCLEITGHVELLPMTPVLKIFRYFGEKEPGNFILFLQQASHSLEVLSMEHLALYAMSSFEQLKELSANKVFGFRPNFPKLETLRINDYVAKQKMMSLINIFGIKDLTLKGVESDSRELVEYVKCLELKKLTLKISCLFDKQNVLNSVNVNLEHLTISHDADVSRFIHLKTLHINSTHGQIILPPQVDTIIVSRCCNYCNPLSVKQLCTYTVIQTTELRMDMSIFHSNLFQACLKGGVRILKLDFSGMTYAGDFYKTLSMVKDNSVFAVYVYINLNRRAYLKKLVRRFCKKLKVFEFKDPAELEIYDPAEPKIYY
jgi:hypothetical protein